MKRFLLSALCACAALTILTPQSLAQTTGTTGTSTATGTGTGTSTSTTTGGRRRGGEMENLEKRAREIIAKYDKDGDHALNANELAAFFEAMHQRREERQGQTGGTATTTSAGATQAHTPLEHAQKAIEKFDKNGDGKLEARELVALLIAIHEREHKGQGQGKVAPSTTTPAAPPQS